MLQCVLGCLPFHAFMFTFLLSFSFLFVLSLSFPGSSLYLFESRYISLVFLFVLAPLFFSFPFPFPVHQFHFSDSSLFFLFFLLPPSLLVFLLSFPFPGSSIHLSESKYIPPDRSLPPFPLHRFQEDAGRWMALASFNNLYGYQTQKGSLIPAQSLALLGVLVPPLRRNIIKRIFLADPPWYSFTGLARVVVRCCSFSFIEQR